jgi:hypothetical protein
VRERAGYPLQTHLAYGSMLSVWRRYPARSSDTHQLTAEFTQLLSKLDG